MNSKALYTLEFDKITELLAELAPTEGSAEMAHNLTPSSDNGRKDSHRTEGNTLLRQSKRHTSER